jgi:hypothetical protein
MADRYLTRQYPASFRGVQFWVRSESKDRDGLRYIIHEYPNSATRYAEYQGEISPTFTVDAFVYGENRLELASALRRALKTPGPGPLVLSTYGSFNAVALDFSERAEQTSVGEITFRIPFVTGVGAVAPAKAPPGIEDVFDQGDSARAALEDAIEDRWIRPKTQPNVIVGRFDILSIAAAADEVITETSATLHNSINYIYIGVGSLLNDPANLAQSLFATPAGLFTAISTALGKTKASLAEILALTNYGTKLALSLAIIRGSDPDNDVRYSGTQIPLWSETTAERIERNTNRKTLVQATRIAALVSAYEQAAAIETYTTKDDVAEAISDIEGQYKILYEDQSNDTTSIANGPVVHRAIEAVRSSALDVLQRKRQQAYGLVQLPVIPGQSAIELSYRLYAEDITDSDILTARAAEIRRLNPDKSAIDLSGDIDVLQI